MEALAAQPEIITEKSFDILASTNLLRYDLEQLGQIQPETRARVCDEELSFLVEGMDRASRTEFVLKREDDQLVYFDKGDWKPYMSTLFKGVTVAEAEAKQDPRRSFLAERAAADLRHGYEMQALQPGEQKIWYSPYPQTEADTYGEKFVKSIGFSPERKMGFLYRALCQEDGSLLMESQTVDSSDPDAFNAVMKTVEYDSEADLTTLTRTYDGALMKKHGGYFFAGRRDAQDKENAWDSIQEHKDLIQFHLDELENIAALDLSDYEAETVVKKHLYGVWAAFKKRIDGTGLLPNPQFAHNFGSGVVINVPPPNLRNEIQFAFNDFVSQGRVMVGCGGSVSVQSISGEGDLLNASPQDVFNTIFGIAEGSSSKEKYSFNKKMYCVVCQTPPEKTASKKDCGPCGLCKTCDKKAGGDG